MDITIRHGVPADARLLADLAARTFRETFAIENRPEDMALHVGGAYGVSQQQAELANPEITTFLAEVDAQLTGYAQLRANAAPDCVMGATPLELERNERAKAFYRKCGFADVGSQVFVLGTDAQTDRIMVRSLPKLTRAV